MASASSSWRRRRDRYRSSAAAAPGRTGWSPAAARSARRRQPTSSLTSIARVGPERAIDFFRRRGGDGEPRAGADVDVDVEAVAAGHAAGGIDDARHRARRRYGRWESAPAASRPRATRRAPAAAGAAATVKRDAADARDWRRRRRCVTVALAAIDRPLDHPASDRHGALAARLRRDRRGRRNRRRRRGP